jgi:thiamine biosynthesis lipoprotein
VILLFALFLLVCRGECPAAAPELKRFVYERAEMGVPFRITFFAADATAADAAAEAAFARVHALDSILSDYDSDSELSRLSRTTGRAVALSTELWRVLEASQKLAARTAGAFDVTVGPLVNLWRRARRKHELPDTELLAQMRNRVGYINLHLDPERRTAQLSLPDMRLDLGAIAKGYAADEALAVLAGRGFSRALVAASGDMAVGDPPPGEEGWRVEIAPLDVPGGPGAQILPVKNCGIATSGDVYQRLEIDGVRYSHIIDPRTGLGLTDHSLVTVLAPDCITADSLATAVSVLGPSEGLRLIEETPGAAARIIRNPAEKIEVFESARWSAVPKQR